MEGRAEPARGQVPQGAGTYQPELILAGRGDLDGQRRLEGLAVLLGSTQGRYHSTREFRETTCTSRECGHGKTQLSTLTHTYTHTKTHAPLSPALPLSSDWVVCRMPVSPRPRSAAPRPECGERGPGQLGRSAPVAATADGNRQHTMTTEAQQHEHRAAAKEKEGDKTRGGRAQHSRGKQGVRSGPVHGVERM